MPCKAYCSTTGYAQDEVLLDVFTALVAFAETGKPRPWWLLARQRAAAAYRSSERGGGERRSEQAVRGGTRCAWQRLVERVGAQDVRVPQQLWGIKLVRGRRRSGLEAWDKIGYAAAGVPEDLMD